MKKILILTLTLILTLSMTVFADGASIPSGGGSSSGGGGGSSGSISGGSSGGAAPSVFPYTEYTITGSISLPNGEVAPEEGIALTITHVVVDKTDVSYGAGTVSISQPAEALYIDAGENSVDYTIKRYIIDSAETIACKVVLKDNPQDMFLQTNFSDEIEIGNDKNITADIYVKRPESFINGRYELIDERVLSEDLSVRLKLYKYHEGIEAYNKVYTVPAGYSAVEFSIPAELNTNYILSYEAMPDSSGQQHIVPDEVIYEEEIITTTSIISDIVISPTYRDVVSGTITLGGNTVAPEGGLEIEIIGGSSYTLIIPEGENSIDYTVAYADTISIYQINVKDNQIFYYDAKITNGDTNYDVVLEPMFSIYGEISIDEPAIDDVKVAIDAGRIATTVIIPEGSTKASYSIDLQHYDLKVGDKINITVHDGTNSEKYVHFESFDIAPVVLEKYNTEYNFEPITIKKTVEIFKGTINVPSELINAKSYIYINAYNADVELQAKLRTDGKSSTIDYVLYGETESFKDYNGEYVFYVEYEDYSLFDVFYNNGTFSLENKSGISVLNETTELDIVLPEPNMEVSGAISLPKASDKEMELVLTLYDQYGNMREDKSIVIPNNTSSYEYSVAFPARTDIGEYKIGYYLQGANTSPYVDGLEVYIGENKYIADIDEANSFSANAENKNIGIDLSPFYCSAYIEGTINLIGDIPRNGTYFDVDVYATNGIDEYRKSVVFNEGDSSQKYSISIPEIYADGDWVVYYMVGNASSIPSRPSIPNEVIRDSDFSISPSAPGTGGNGVIRPQYPRYQIPFDIVKGTKGYYSDKGMVFDEENATKILFSGGGHSGIDFVVLTVDMDYPRNIGGYFLTTEKGVKVTIDLIDYDTKNVVATQHIICENEATWYNFELVGGGSYQIRYTYNDKVYYYIKTTDLTDNIDDAYVIGSDADPNQYGFNVYYENIKKYPCNTNTRYLHNNVAVSYSEENVYVSLYDPFGNLLCREPIGTQLQTEEKDVYIAIEFGGQRRFFTSKPKGKREFILDEMVPSFKGARLYTLPHVSETGISVVLDASEFICGQSIGNDGSINESYFNYTTTDNGIMIDTLYIDATQSMYEEGNTIYIALYDKDNRLLDLQTVIVEPANKVVTIDKLLPHDGHIKIMGWKSQLQPIVDVVNFFGE